MLIPCIACATMYKLQYCAWANHALKHKYPPSYTNASCLASPLKVKFAALINPYISCVDIYNTKPIG